MMNIAEAKKNVATYVETEAAKVIGQIETLIVNASKTGGHRVNFYLSNSINDEVRKAIIAEVTEAGYEMIYNQSTRGLHLSW